MDPLDLGQTIRAFRPGQTFFNQRYTLVKILGRGGMGVVWLARDEELRSEVALKFLPEVIMGDKGALEDLRREARRCRELTHPHVLRIHDFVREDTAVAISMEYVTGGNLDRLRASQPHGVFTPGQLSPWVGQLCAALHYAHGEARLVHRDLKPANLMLDGQNRLKVADFGISRSITESLSRNSRSGSTSGEGSLPYMSPQQLAGDQPSPADDLYALGATLYELLTGKPPFHSGGLGVIMRQIQTEIAPPMVTRRLALGVPPEAGDIPPAWESIIAACLAKDPARRPPDALTIAAGLAVPTAHSPAAPPAYAPAPVPGALGRSFLAAVAVLLLLGVCAAGYFAVYRPAQARSAEAAQAARAAELARVEAARLAAARGGLLITTEPPGAEVTVGIQERGRSPLTLNSLPIGSHRFTVFLPGYDEYRGEIEVKENDFTRRLVELTRSLGSVEVGGEAGAPYVLVGPDGVRRTGATPQTEAGLPTGEYTLAVPRQNVPDSHSPLVVRSGETTRISPPSSFGRLEITSRPTGAAVFDDTGRKLGVTPLIYPMIRTGRVSLELRDRARINTWHHVDIKAAGTIRIAAELKVAIYPRKGELHENSLGMRFIALRGMLPLVSVWETREQDYRAFCTATRRPWPFAANIDAFPAQSVSWEDAQAFCGWLTQKEQREGRIGPKQRYRLPTDHEWSLALGLAANPATENPNRFPAENHLKLGDHYPWGPGWPLPPDFGNYGVATVRGRNGATELVYKSITEQKIRPVGSYTSKRVIESPPYTRREVLFDLGGNLAEWVQDTWDAQDSRRVLRGASYRDADREKLLSSAREAAPPDTISDRYGFRVVIDLGDN
jgi:hypothetical protein